jgi:hypothetical protein
MNGLPLRDQSFANVGLLYIEPCKIARRLMPSHPHFCPSKSASPLTGGVPSAGTFLGAGSLLSSTIKPMSQTRAISSAQFWVLKTKSAITLPSSSIATVAAGALAGAASSQS